MQQKGIYSPKWQEKFSQKIGNLNIFSRQHNLCMYRYMFHTGKLKGDEILHDF